MASTRLIQTTLPDFHKKISAPEAQETLPHLKLPQKPETIEFEINKWEPPTILENYIPQPSIRVSA